MIGMAMMYDWMLGTGGVIFMLLFFTLIGVGIVLLVHYVVSETKPQPRNTALEILRQRYAKGEIDRKEFEERRRDLEKI